MLEVGSQGCPAHFDDEHSEETTMQDRGSFLVEEESTELAPVPMVTEIDVEEDLSTVIDASAAWDPRPTRLESQATAVEAVEEIESSRMLTDTGPAPRSPRRTPAMSDAYGYLARGVQDREGPLMLNRTPGGTPVHVSSSGGAP